MKILITGATGLVGTEIVALCKKQHIAVHYLTTRKKKIGSIAGCRGFLWNPSKGEIDIQCFEGVTVIINLAGASIAKRWTKAYKKTILASRIDSLKTLRKGLKESNVAGVNALVTASAIGIYPNSYANFYDESNQDIDPSFLGEVVAAWEVEASHFANLGLAVAKIRIGLVLSAFGGALTEMTKPIKNYMGAAFGTGKQWQSWIHIHDLAKIFLFAAKQN